MRRLSSMAPLVAALAATVLVTSSFAGGAARGSAAVAFSATYSGKATVKVTGQTANVAAQGKGTGTLVGASSIRGQATGDTSSPPCAIWSGLATITSPRGTLKIAVLAGAQACAAEDNQNHVTVSGKIKVSGGTGKFAKAKGALRFAGKLDRGTGLFSVKLTGALTV